MTKACYKIMQMSKIHYLQCKTDQTDFNVTENKADNKVQISHYNESLRSYLLWSFNNVSKRNIHNYLKILIKYSFPILICVKPEFIIYSEHSATLQQIERKSK